MTSSRPILIEADNLSRSYQRGQETVRALDGVSFVIRQGEFVSVSGPSGSGKTTLLNLVGCLDAPGSGTLLWDGLNVSTASDAQRTLVRREKVGFIFQHFGLLPTLTVAQNVALPGLFARRHSKKIEVDELLSTVGLLHRRNHLPRELSGGEMQRVAIARALVNSPNLLLADEPTGNLDSAAGEKIIDLFQSLQQAGVTIIVVTHNPALAQAASRQLLLRDGCLTGDAS